jgi:nucleotide-binding universal stress UspA family protein
MVPPFREWAIAAIIERARAEIMASHGRRGVERMLPGSQAAEVVSGSSKPVLIVK